MPAATGQGFDVDLCRAVAAAVLGDADQGQVRADHRRDPLYRAGFGRGRRAGPQLDLDLLARCDLKLDFVAINYYDGQGFMVKKDLGVSSAKELDGATVCIQTGTTTELNLADFFKQNNITYTPVTVQTTPKRSASIWPAPATPTPPTPRALPRRALPCPMPENHIILPEIISKEPLGPGGSPWRQPVGRRRALDLLRAADCRRKGHHQGQYRGSEASTTDPKRSSVCWAS
jgi:general L-amino acid transport system substrate-binding protein